MSTKSKIAVGLIVFILIVFGFIINGIAANVSTTYVPDLNSEPGSDLNDLARIAAKQGNYYLASFDFFDIPASQLYGLYINQAPSAVWYRSGMCMYHMQSTGSWSDYGKFYIYNVLDFDLVDGELELKNNGVPVSNTNASTWTLAKILNGIWDNSPAYDYEAADGGTYSNDWKNAGLYAFYVANNHNNLGNINSNYIGTRSYTGGETTEYTNSKNYGTEANQYRKITKVTTTPSAVNNGDYTVIGPLKIKYGLKDVDNVTIKSGSNSVSTGIYYTTDSYSSAEDVANNISSVSKSNRLYNIPSDKNFYLIVSDSDQKYVQDSGVKVTIEQETFKYYKARLVLAGKKVADAQQVGIFASDEKTYNGSVSWDITDIQKDNFKIIINKKNEDSEKVSGAKFKIEVLQGTNHKGWLNYSGSKYNYDASSAYTWTTNSGKIEIKGLSADYSYKVFEVSTPSNYLGLEYQIGAGMTVNGNTLESGAYDSTNGIDCGTALGSKTANEVTFNIKNIKRYLEININKKDEIGRSDYVDGAEFKIYVENTGKWLGYSGGRYTYNESFTSAKSWRISGGTVKISGLIADNKYKVYETKQPDNFLALDEQIEAGIKITIGGTNITPQYESGKGIYCGTVQYSGSSPIVQIDVENREEYLNISGIIWEDALETKSDDQQVYNSLYGDSEDKKFDGEDKEVKVSLIDKDGNVVKDVITRNGKYDFETDITVTRTMSDAQVGAKLNGYYLKFEYDSQYQEDSNNRIISYYSTVAPKFNEVNGSKALPNKGGDNENVFNKEKVDTYIYNLSDFVTKYNGTDKKFYKFNKLENMNMGLVLLQDQYDFDVNQVIEYVQVRINGYKYTYKYGENGKVEYSASPTVQWDNGWAYTRPIYPSDIAYSLEEDGITWKSGGLEVYVVYRIDIQNQNPNGKVSISESGQVSYIEKSLKDITINNRYDDYRYTLSKVDTTVDAGLDSSIASNIRNSINKWSDYSETGNDPDEGRDYKYYKYDDSMNIDANDTKSVYIQYKINNVALKDLLNGNDEKYEDKATKAYVTGKHKYVKSYYGWNTDNSTYSLATPTLETKEQTKTSESIYLKLTLGTERRITGTVFEDAIDNIRKTNTGEELGNGKYDSGENKIESVKIDLLNQDKTLAEIYPKDKEYSSKNTAENTDGNLDGLNIKSDNKGTYTIVGVVPGKYYLRYTYGDGTQKLYDIDGNLLKDLENNEITISIADYKSTIVTENNIKNALIAETDTEKEDNANWYKNVSDIDYSTAVDDLKQRAEFNTGKDQDTGADLDSPRKVIEAKTGLMDVGVENTKEDSVAVTASDNEDYNPDNPTRYGIVEKIQGINFGIIKHPDVNIDVDKVVNNIKITNAQGNIIAEGNPATSNIPYVSNLDADPHIVKGSTYVKAEINEEELYGSTLELKYAITVRNRSAVNYYEKLKIDMSNSDYHGYYYWFGDKTTPDSEEVTVTINEVYDFIDSSVKYENLSIDANHKISKESIESVVSSDELDEIKRSANVSYDYVVSIKGKNAEDKWNALYTTKNPSREATETTQETAHLTASRLLSMEDDDLFVSNIAQVVQLEITGKPKLVETISKDSKYFDSYYTNPTREVYVTVTPPTGKDTITPIVYIITTIIAGVAIAGGVILIKKKVLDK